MNNSIINYSSRKGGKKIKCITCGFWYASGDMIKGVCAICNADFERIKEHGQTKRM